VPRETCLDRLRSGHLRVVPGPCRALLSRRTIASHAARLWRRARPQAYGRILYRRVSLPAPTRWAIRVWMPGLCHCWPRRPSEQPRPREILFHSQCEPVPIAPAISRVPGHDPSPAGVSGGRPGHPKEAQHGPHPAPTPPSEPTPSARYPGRFGPGRQFGTKRAKQAAYLAQIRTSFLPRGIPQFGGQA
jgi:hypothetical protein